MNNYYYKKTKRKNVKKFFRIFSLLICLGGILGAVYVFFPLISWQVYFAPKNFSPDIAVPIPKTTIVGPETIQSLISQATGNFSGIDYTNAQNWFPNYSPSEKQNAPKVSEYNLSIPKLDIKNAVVSTVDHNLAKHLVNYDGTAIPPNNGNAVIFGHSTLPYLFNPSDYKTIFATLYKLKTGDDFSVSINNVSYTYKIFNIIIVEPEDTSIFTQIYDSSYITLVTCTPPGTTWKRLIIKARLQKI